MTDFEVVEAPHENLNIYSFDDFMSLVVVKTGQATGVTLDIRRVRFMDVFAMAWLIYFCQELHENGQEVRLGVDPNQHGANSFLARMGFYDLLGSYVKLPRTITPETLELAAQRRGTNEKLLELTRITDHKGNKKNIIRPLRQVLEQRMYYPENAVNDISLMVAELCTNVRDHNPDSTGIAAMQEYTVNGARSLQLVIADHGAGIATTLRRNPKYRFLSEIRLLRTSMQNSVSEFDDFDRGTGLYHLQRLLKRQRGTLDLRSSRSKIHLSQDGQITEHTVSYLAGTQVVLNIPNWDR